MENRVERLLGAAVVGGALATIPLTVAQEQDLAGPLVTGGDWLVWAIFTAEFSVMLFRSVDRVRYARDHWLDLLIIIVSFPELPTLLALVRLARLGRLLRLVTLTGRTAIGLRALRIVLGRAGMVYVGAVTGLLIVAGAGGLSILEPEAIGGGFWNGIWWAVVTATTVGYGDIAPVTAWGRLLGVALMFTGVGLISTLSASVAAYFVGEDRTSEFAALTERLDRIEDLLQQIQRLRQDSAR